MGNGGIRWFIWCALLLPPAAGFAESGARPEALFYHGQTYGSEASFNPLSSAVNWTVDTLQVPDSFNDQGFHRSLNDTVKSLLHPDWAMRTEGGYKNFINRQIVPVSLNRINDSREAVPNYFLHLLGGGMVYRKNVEWFEANGYGYPRLFAASMVMTAEFLQEVIEKKSTPADDPVADFYPFRPAGMLLFSWEPAARFAAEKMRLVEWPYQPMLNGYGDFVNVGENWAVRPELFGSDRMRAFVFFGLTNLVGLSHRLNQSDSLSWGAGAAITNGSRDHFSVRPSCGAFYDRNDSQLWSVIVHGTDELAVRLNVFPEVVHIGSVSPGFYLGIGDHGDVSGGVMITASPVGFSLDL